VNHPIPALFQYNNWVGPLNDDCYVLREGPDAPYQNTPPVQDEEREREESSTIAICMRRTVSIHKPSVLGLCTVNF